MSRSVAELPRQLVVEVAEVHGFHDAQRLRGLASSIKGVLSVNLKLDLGSSTSLLSIGYDNKMVQPDQVVKELKRLNLRISKPAKGSKSLDIAGAAGYCAC